MLDGNLIRVYSCSFVVSFSKWGHEINKFIQSASNDVGSHSQWKAINGLSNWPLLDKYLTELWGTTQVEGVSGQPCYGIATDFVVEGKLAKAVVPLSTDGGIIAGLNGNSIDRIDAGSINIFMKNISGKWLVCHENEYNGELETKKIRATPNNKAMDPSRICGQF